MQDLALRSPVALAVAVGATTPAPAAGQFPILWSTSEAKHLYWNGASWQAFGGGAAAIFAVAAVDFGAAPVLAKTFDVAVGAAVAGQRVVAAPSLAMPGSESEDEFEMDMLACAGRVVSNGNVRLTVASLGAPVAGQRNINLTLG